MNKPKESTNKLISVIFAVVLGLAIGFGSSIIISKTNSNELPALPAPELSEGQRGELGIDKNINESTIDNVFSLTITSAVSSAFTAVVSLTGFVNNGLNTG